MDFIGNCNRLSLHHYVICPFMESVGHVGERLNKVLSAICFRLFSNRYRIRWVGGRGELGQFSGLMVGPSLARSNSQSELRIRHILPVRGIWHL